MPGLSPGSSATLRNSAFFCSAVRVLNTVIWMFGLPDLPRLPVLLHTRVMDGRSRDALAALAAAFRSAVR